MVTLRCTQKLLRRLKGSPQTSAVPPTTRLGDWYVNILFSRPRHLLLCVSERTLLPVLVPARDLGTLALRLRQGLNEVLAALGIPPPVITAELLQMAAYAFGPTASRQVLGSMNDFAKMMAWRHEADQDFDLLDMALRLAESPCSPLGYTSPDRVTQQVFWGGSPASSTPINR